MKKAKLLIGILTVLGILLSTGCQDKDIDHNQQGRLVVKLTDAPFPIDTIESATVSIVKVEIRKVGGGDQQEYPFVDLPMLEETMELNLLDLRNGVTASLIDMEIEPGSYDLIRLYVDEASLSIKEGETYTLKVPSGSQTGIKLFMDPALNVAGGLTTEVLLDFNVEKSFVLKGNMGTPAGIKGFNFKPVIRAVNNTTTGTVAGVVDYADTLQKNVSVWIAQDTIITSAFTDTTGYYAMPGIPAGFYSVSAAKEGFDTITVEGVQIVEGNLTTQNFSLTLVEEPVEE